MCDYSQETSIKWHLAFFITFCEQDNKNHNIFNVQYHKKYFIKDHKKHGILFTQNSVRIFYRIFPINCIVETEFSV